VAVSRYRAACHESAHATICEKLGGVVLSVTIEPPWCQFFLLGCTKAATHHAHIITAMAGYLAEALLLGTCSTDTARGDRENWRERLMKGCCHRAGDPRHARRLARFALRLVLRHRVAIQQLAAKLQCDASVAFDGGRGHLEVADA